MARDFNQAIVMGNLTRDPELKTIPSGQQVASFAVATNRSWNDQASGEKREDVQYHEIVVWGKLAELAANYLSKGRKALIVGRLQTRQWEAQDGSKRQRTEIVASDIHFVDRAPEGSGTMTASSERSAAKKPTKKDQDVVIEDMGEGEINLDDIPF